MTPDDGALNIITMQKVVLLIFLLRILIYYRLSYAKGAMQRNRIETVCTKGSQERFPALFIMPLSMSVIFIRVCYPWMTLSSMDEVPP